MQYKHPGNYPCGNRVVAATRQLIECLKFCAAHRVRAEDFTRRRSLPFDCMIVLLLQKSVRSAQAHLHDFFDRLGRSLEPVSASAWSQGRLKLRHAAFIELNQKAVLDVIDAADTDFKIHLWEGWRLLAVDSSLIGLPNEEEIGREFGWVECANQRGACGRYAQGRISVLTDVLNHLAIEARLVAWRVGERKLALEHLGALKPQDLTLMDRGYASYELFAQFISQGRQFVCRCAGNSFGAANRLFKEGKAGASITVELRPPDGRGKARAMAQAGLPAKISVRFVSVALPDGRLEVIATSLVDQTRYPSALFGPLYQKRWGIETYYGILKSRLDLENFTGRSVEAVRQDFHAAIFLSNLETVLTRPSQEYLAPRPPEGRSQRVNHALSFHTIKNRMIELLISQEPIEAVVARLQHLFLANPVSVRPERKPPRKKASPWRSYRYQRYIKKTVF
jgi:Transposase DDE domain